MGPLKHILRRLVHTSGFTAIAVFTPALDIAAGLTRYMKTLLHGVTPLDPLTYIAVPLVLAAAAASYFPARRATRVDPMDALRAE